MKRLIATTACSIALITGAGSGAAFAAQPAPAPTPLLSVAEACDRSRTTMLDGIKTFTTEMDKAGASATSGDMPNADKSVKQSGVLLVDLSGKLRKDAETAQSTELRKALEDVAKELETLGTNLTGMSSIANFNTQNLEKASNHVAEVCQR